MGDHLEQLNHRYEEISAQLSSPETYDNPALVAALNREQRELEGVVTCWRSLTATQEELALAQEMLHDPDGEVRELAREEFPLIKQRLEELEEQLQILLLPKDPDDDKDVIVEIRAGVGGEEAALFAHSLHRMYHSAYGVQFRLNMHCFAVIGKTDQAKLSLSFF